MLAPISVMDIDDDGYEDDIIVGDHNTSSSPEHNLLWALDNDNNTLWTYTYDTIHYATNLHDILTISIEDINDDGVKDIVTGIGDSEEIVVVNKSGSLLWNYIIGEGRIGIYYGTSTSTSTSTDALRAFKFFNKREYSDPKGR